MLKMRLESGGVARDLPQVLTITGNRFAFDNAGFAPAAGTVYVASTNPVLRLNWASNQAESPAVLYTVLGRFATSGAGSAFGILGSTTAKTVEVNTGSNTLLEWRVVALWEGLEFTGSGAHFTAIFRRTRIAVSFGCERASREEKWPAGLFKHGGQSRATPGFPGRWPPSACER